VRRYLVTGILIWLPLGVTVLVVRLLVNVMDRTLLLLPPDWRPEAVFGFNVPGLGFVLAFAVVLATGVLFANLLGRRLVTLWESIFSRIPLIRTVYSGVKQITESVLADKGASFRKVLLIEYPRKGLWALVFQTSDTLGEVQEKTSEEMVAVFLPTTPNPTSGFILLVPRKDIVELDMSVDEGLKMIISVGTAVPEWPPEAKARLHPVPAAVAGDRRPGSP